MKRLDDYSAEAGNWRLSRARVMGTWKYTFWQRVNGQWVSRGEPKDLGKAREVFDGE